jgi:non-ribosomal peptide synthase protein (TIGR01720 family)
VGGDSILLLKLSASLRRQGLSFAAKAFYAEPTVEALARLVEKTGDDGDAAAAAQGEQRLHPMQSWFLHQAGEEPWHYNQSVIVELRDTAFPFTAAPEVVAALLERHDALRLGFARDGEGSWRAAYRELTPAMVAACIHDIEVTGEDIEREASRIQRGLSLDGPLFRLARLRLPDGGARLLIVVHHLVVDGVSWRVLLHDLDMAFRSAAQGQPAALPPRTATYQRAVARLEELAGSPAARDELPYWREVLRARLPALRGGAEHDDVMADEASEAIAFPSELTDALLTGSRRAGGLTIGEALVSALRIAFRAWRGADTLGLVMEGHGRSLLGESLDVGETVGWFTASYPVAFAALDASADTTAWLRDTRDVLRGVPVGGERFGALQCFGGAGTDLDDGAFRRDAVRFNYLGQFDQALHDESAFAIAGERSGENISPRQRRDAPLAFDGMVSGGRLRFSLKYNRRRHAGEDMRRLLDAFGAALVEVAACWRSAALSGIGRADARWLDVGDEEIAEWNRRWPEVVAAYPATPGQQGMLVRSLRDGRGERASFVNQLIFDIQGRLDKERLRSAWEGFAQRHDVFRTAFVPLRRGGMAQLLLAADAVRLPCRWLDLSEASPAEQVSAIDTAIAADRGLGFDLGEAPLSRVTVWRLGEDRHRVLWSTHHALVDGWSIPLAFRSLLDAYTAGPGASRSVHPGFREYVAWRQSRDMRADREYWRGRLAGLEAPCLLAPRRVGADTSAALVRDIRLEAADVDGLERLARSCWVTVYSVLQCAWAWMLRLYTGRNSVCFGSVASGRPDDLPGADATIGLFINTLPVVGTIDEALPLRAWLQEIQGTQADAQAFGTLALAEILPLAPGGGQAALFDSVLVYENYPVDSIRETGDAAGPRIVGLRSDESTGTGLTVAMMPGPGKVLGVRFMFHDGEFPVAFVDRLADQFIQLLRGMPALAEGSVGELGDLLVEAPAHVAAADAQVASLSDDELLALLSQLEADTE